MQKHYDEQQLSWDREKARKQNEEKKKQVAEATAIAKSKKDDEVSN